MELTRSCNLKNKGVASYNNVVFTFANSDAIGAWKDQIAINLLSKGPIRHV
jgi:hypothetical protein